MNDNKVIEKKQRTIQASAPATLMLLGEYAVLHGYPAVVLALNKRIHVTITSQQSKCITLTTSLGNFRGTQSELTNHPKFNYLLAAMEQFPQELSHAHIHIDSELSHLWGLGSSSAVTIATLAVLHQWWYGTKILAQDLFKMGLNCLQYLNKKGSGADMAGAAFGGMLAIKGTEIQPLQVNAAFFVIYTGQKASTDCAINLVQGNQDIYQKMGQCSEFGIEAITQNNTALLAKCMREQHLLLSELGVNIALGDAIVTHCYEHKLTDAIKISGAGFGDCLIGLKNNEAAAIPPLPPSLYPARYLDVQPEQQGVIYAGS